MCRRKVGNKNLNRQSVSAPSSPAGSPPLSRNPSATKINKSNFVNKSNLQ